MLVHFRSQKTRITNLFKFNLVSFGSVLLRYEIYFCVIFIKIMSDWIRSTIELQMPEITNVSLYFYTVHVCRNAFNTPELKPLLEYLGCREFVLSFQVKVFFYDSVFHLPCFLVPLHLPGLFEYNLIVPFGI